MAQSGASEPHRPAGTVRRSPRCSVRPARVRSLRFDPDRLCLLDVPTLLLVGSDSTPYHKGTVATSTPPYQLLRSPSCQGSSTTPTSRPPLYSRLRIFAIPHNNWTPIYPELLSCLLACNQTSKGGPTTMYVRINQTRFDPLREQQARRFIEERVVPAVQQLPGFRRYAGSWSPTGIIGTTRRRSQRGIHTVHRVGSSRLPPAAQRWPYHRSAHPPDWRAVGFCRRKIAWYKSRAT